MRVFLDANVLYSKILMVVFLDMAEKEIITFLWSEEVMAEFERNRIKKSQRPDRVQSTIKDIKKAFAAGEIQSTDYEQIKSGLIKTHPKDRHILAAASVSGAQVLVTLNGNDFDKGEAKKLKVKIQHPDKVLCELYSKSKTKVLGSIKHSRGRRQKPPTSEPEFIDLLKRANVPKFATKLARHAEKY